MSPTAFPSSSRAAARIIDASKPYDSSALSDVILRSCDSIDFFVLWPLLRIASPVFDDMFSFGAAATEEDRRNGLPIVAVSEDSETLLSLLSLIYPYDPEPRMVCAAIFSKVCRAVQKYSMDAVERKLRARLNKIKPPNTLATDHLLLYAIAVQFGWRAEAIKAAQRTASIPLTALPFNDELRNISGADFYEYLSFRTGSKILLPTKKLSSIATMATVDSNNPVRDAKDPFDSSAKADIILRSSDRIDFYVLRGLLGLVTPAFDGVNSTNQKNGIPIIDLEENDKILQHLLSLIYPRVGDQTLDLETFVKVGRAAKRYRMDVVSKKLRQQLYTSRHIVKDPIRTMWIAISFGWGQVAKKAARNAMKLADGAKISWVEELRLVSGADVYRFIEYWSACRVAACKALLKVELFASGVRNERAVTKRIIKRLIEVPRGSSIVEATYTPGAQRESKYERWFADDVWKKRGELMEAVEDAVSEVPFRLDSCLDGPQQHGRHGQ